MSDTSPARFSFTKLIVADLENSIRFYKSVCGLSEAGRVKSEIRGRAFEEAVMVNAAGEDNFILLAYIDTPKPAESEVIIGFMSSDADAFVARAQAAGGSVVKPVIPMKELGRSFKVGFVADNEGHLIEVVQMDT